MAGFLRSDLLPLGYFACSIMQNLLLTCFLLRIIPYQILNSCSFSLPSGKKAAIVGGSGCGKSTVIRMLYRFYDPDSGQININGQDIKQVREVLLI